ncbi:nuclear transport factor 2 family protein [Brevundimonas sp.]|uniref:nuclear transport factor 2 family protein n=1 Tax=Brevundimonas sp. TaxID=1871086 RepID=UPI001D89ED28|nr:nuclear transport factor 2 family protein [Brevundimonas sp.]MBL0946533.1 nuclear transport factor 2 family protein [Brevundimonas sp.]
MGADAEIRDLISRWARAVGDQDIAGILAHHSDDMLMFDVPPPAVLRGLQAYRESWTPFFEWARGGLVFDIISMDVTAGDDVAFATALLQCGRPGALDPLCPLRLTVGLSRTDGHWTIVHEHHSFPDRSVGHPA